MSSEEFFAKYTKGETSDDEVFVEWAGNYQHYLALSFYAVNKGQIDAAIASEQSLEIANG
ncbi:MAG: hypothetical protein KME21_25740 [Desmonostoc vinosum HA7617-LM4]|jgi:hypothetical protein|nr:hypothetical protein [Desmonostoc vinosum HA7617-LM4]